MSTVQAAGMRRFTMIWLGQLVSMLGTNMTRFALAIWIWEERHEALPVTLMGVANGVTLVIVSPFAGALVDRWDRKRVMMLSDLGAGLGSVAILLLSLSNNLQIGDLYIVSALVGGLGAFQWLAYSAITTSLVPKEHYTRASGMGSLAEYASLIATPILAGILLSAVGLTAVLLIDVVTFIVAVSTLLLIPVPPIIPRHEEASRTRNLLGDSLYGFRYIFQRPGLTGLLLVYFAFCLAEAFGYPLIVPMILARSGNNEALLGIVRAVMGVGGVIGGVLLTIWGGPKRKIHGVLIGLALTGILGDALMGSGQGLVMWLFAGFCLEAFIPTVLGAGNAVWRSKVAPEVQGRVFAARGLVTSVAEPISMVLAGLLVDRVFEPAMMPRGSLAGVFGGLVGTGPGAGMGLLLVISGILAALAGVMGYIFASVRNIEQLLPDHDTPA